MFTALLLSLLLGAATPAQANGGGAFPEGSEVIERQTRTYQFTYAYPIEASAIPAIHSLLRADAARAQAATARAAAESRRDAGRGHFLPHEFRQEWRTDANLTELIALSASIYSFTGGAHGNSQFTTFLWDRSARERIQFADLFSDPVAAMAEIQRSFCPLLDQERARRREGEEGRDDCPAVEDHPMTVVVGPSGRIEAFRVLIEPYAAGSYVEGTYEIEVPISDSLLRLVRARFGAGFVFR